VRSSTGICRLALAAAVVAGLSLHGGTAARESSTEGVVGFSKPLTHFSLEDLFPVRTETEIETEEAYARSWRKQAETLAERAAVREEESRRSIEVKSSEIKSLETRIKHAKKLETPAERDRLKDALKVEKQALEALESVREFSEGERKLARTWDEAGQALERATAIEREIMALRASRSKSDGRSADTPDPRGQRLHDSLNKEIGAAGRAMENAGEQVAKLAEQRERVLRYWRSFTR
jgi:hypothetical protein